MEITLLDFSPAIKKSIIERDNHKCVVCGRGENHGVELHVDHIKPKSLGGDDSKENGQTLCSEHNMAKKDLGYTEFGKGMFLRLYDHAITTQNENLKMFCSEVLETYEKYAIDGHID